MKDYQRFLLEIKQNPIYKNFKTGELSQLRKTFSSDISDNTFTSQEGIAKQILDSLSSMKIGFEFECYLKDSESLSNKKIIERIDLEEIFPENYLNFLMSHFPENNHHLSYKGLKREYDKWFQERMYEMIDINDVNDELKKENEKDENKRQKKKLEIQRKLQDEFAEQYRDDEEYSFSTFLSSEFKIEDLLEDFNFLDGSNYYIDDEGYLLKTVSTDTFSPSSKNKNDKDIFYSKVSSVLQDEFDTKVNWTKRKSSIQFKKDYHNAWTLEEDESLNQIPSSNFIPIEIISKTYSAKSFRDIFFRTKKCLSNAGFEPKTNTSTGVHFSVSFNDAKQNSEIDFLKLVILGQDNFFLRRIGRQFNKYCVSQLVSVKDSIKTLTRSFKRPLTIDDLLKRHYIYTLKTAISNQKRMSINFSKYNKNGEGFIEFRLMGNDYFGDKEEANLLSMEWFLYILIASTSPTLWQDEYFSWIINYSTQCYEEMIKTGN